MARFLQVKTLKGESFQIEVAPEAVMSDVKTKISEQRGVDPASQVLICNGKTLKDGDALSSSVAAGGFLVLMVKAKRRATPVATKPSPLPSSSSSSATPATAATNTAGTAAPPPPTAPSSATSATAAAAPTTTAPAAAAAAATAATAAVATATPATTTTEAVGGAGAGAAAAAAAANAAGEELAIDPASVEMLTAMGFPEDQARAALRAAFNDVSRAASYLMEGIPEGVAATAAAGALSDERDGGDEEGEDDVPLGLGVEGGGNPLNFMRFHPQFDQLRGLIRDNPAMLPQVLQQLGAQSPELIERINEHPGDFLRLMNEPPDVEGQAMMEMGIESLMDGMEQEDDDEADAAAAGFAAGGGDGGQGQEQGQQVTVELTVEEEAAVQNLMSMVPGVGRDQVMEAFIACDKNAELAANLLFENAF